MPGKIKNRNFKPIFFPSEVKVRRSLKENIDTTEVFGTKGRNSKYHDPVYSQHQEGIKGIDSDYNEQII